MTELLERALEAVRRMPAAEQDAIARAMLSLADRDAAYEIDPEVLQNVMEGSAEVERGEIATEEEVEAAFRHFRP